MGKNPGPGSCAVEAPCKINLHLRVKERRPDGFHELESVFLALSLGDRLEFQLWGEPGRCVIGLEGSVSREFPLEKIPPEQNLVYRAVSLFRERTGFGPGLRVRLEKRVPLGAGFGGGSSDAAATLRALDTLAGTGLSPEALGEMARELGSDVPFFLEGGAAWVSGRGERLRALGAPRGIAVALVYPGFPSPTAEAFRLLDRVRGAGEGRGGPPGPGFEESAALLAGGPGGWPFENDFLPVFLAAGGGPAAAYREILGGLKRLGADFSGLSGAGSGCFGIFKDRGAAEKAVKELSGRWNFVQLTFPLARSGLGVLQ